MTSIDPVIRDLIEKEGWKISAKDGKEVILAYGEVYPVKHPLSIHLKRYRLSKNPEEKYQHMKAAHDYLWPTHIKLWHYWTERRFREHCNGWSYISYAGGAACAKSYDAAKIALLFWLSNPKGHAVIIASTTLNSLGARIWGYAMSLIRDTEMEIPFQYMRSQPPKFLYDRDDLQHGIFAAAAKLGDDDSSIKDIIGRHPKDGILFIADESTDMPMALVKALPNLESGQDFFQAMFIGNSLSKYDLHGVVSTPKNGWGSVDPLKDVQWETTQKNGTCLFFSCYESPAIHETDPVKKKLLSKFLITQATVNEKIKIYGKDSDSFWRFVLGFWRTSSTDDTVVSREFVDNFRVFDSTEWLGIHPLSIVAGLDPAFSTGGDQCILRLAILGQATNGQIVLDYQKEKLLFKIEISAQANKSADLQIADQVISILNDHNCPLHNLCVDANGQGRALGEVIRLRAQALRPPIKIYSTRGGNVAVNSFDVVVKSYHELWFAFRDFIQNAQVKGLDYTTITQLTSRQIVRNEKTLKYQLEPKGAYKRRMGAIMPSLAHSPDEADAAALCLQSAIINYGFTPGQKKDIAPVTSFAHEKYMAYKEEMKMTEQQKKEILEAPPCATFAGDVYMLAQYKPPFSN
jgi:hypothetical protein